LLSITLLDGRAISADIVVAQRTYLRLIEGIPTERLNREILDDIPGLCARALHHEHCVVIPPVLSAHEFRGKKWNALPRILIAGRFSHYNPVRDPTQDFSMLAIAWMQGSLLPLPSEGVLPSLRALDWSRHARDYCY
jgi:hypothetical protein